MFTTIFNPHDGVIIGWGAFSPACMGKKKDPPVTTLPKLQKWSDISFLQWQNLATNPTDVKYIMKVFIENAATQALVYRALQNVGKELSEWPDTTFEMTSPEG